MTALRVETHASRIFTKLGLEAGPAIHRRVLAVLAHLRVSAAPGRNPGVGEGTRDNSPRALVTIAAVNLLLAA